MHQLAPIKSLSSVRSRASNHLSTVQSHRSEIRPITIDRTHAYNDNELLAEIGYKQELNRHYSTLQIFGIAFSIMGLLPSISTVLGTGLSSGPVGLIWGWFASGFFILCIGVSLSVLSSAMPTSGGLYYWTNYYAPDSIRVILSFVIGCGNTIGLVAGFCSINYGFVAELLSCVVIHKDGDFTITNEIMYGVFAASVVSHILLCSLTSKHTAWLQSFSIYVNVFLIVLFIIAVPIGAAKHGFNDSTFIFGKWANETTWNQGWAFMLAWMPCIWTIGSFDACIHMSEEAKNATRGVPIGITSSIFICWILGWLLCIVCVACIKDGDIEAVTGTGFGNAMAQIIFDALGKQWALAFMALIAFAQYLMGASILTAASRQIWAFARDDGLPLHKWVKYVDPFLKVPLRATIFGGCLALLCGLLILIGPTASGALFSLAVASNSLAWGVPILLSILPVGRKRFSAGYFSLGKWGNRICHSIAVTWIFYVIVMQMFPANRQVDKDTMNYTCVINVGVWILAAIYYYVYGYRYYSGPKPNIDDDYEKDSIDYNNIDLVIASPEPKSLDQKSDQKS